MFPNQCDDCFAEQEELLERNPGGCGQVVCWCYTEEDLVRQDEKERNWVEMPDDDDLETAMMILGEEEMDDDKLVIVEDSSSVDGFERESCWQIIIRKIMYLHITLILTQHVRRWKMAMDSSLIGWNWTSPGMLLMSFYKTQNKRLFLEPHILKTIIIIVRN